MRLFPAIDLMEGQAVRLSRGDYSCKTVYSSHPADVASDFRAQGAEYIHIVDLEGARDGTTPNFSVVEQIIRESGLRAEIGGGIRSPQAVEKYLQAGAMRVILGTAAAEDPAFLQEMVENFGSQIAVGADLKDGCVATHGWTEKSAKTGEQFFRELQNLGVETVICTDISRDGLLAGTNLELYQKLHTEFPTIELVASGGISSLQDLVTLQNMGIPSAILGKALYEGRLNLKEAVSTCVRKGDL